ncbi:hypothetical protein PMAYCL1PPCAC_16100, partial [Pristionchus mayeri]
QANLDIVDASIAKLRPAAQEPAKKMRDLVISDEDDLEKFLIESEAIKASVPEEVVEELEAHNEEVARALGLA